MKKIKIIGNIYGMGIYALKDKEGIIRYIGSGMLNDRFQNHSIKLKNNKYKGTNKNILQEKYNNGEELTFEVLHFSQNNSKYINGTDEEKAAIQQGLEVLEQFYYNLFKENLCNKMSKIHKFSTSPTNETTEKRRKKNLGSLNPNCRFSEKLICNVLYLKEQGIKTRQIKEIIMQEFATDISSHYIWCLGKTKWIHISPEYADWMDKYIIEKEAESTAIDTTSQTI